MDITHQEVVHRLPIIVAQLYVGDCELHFIVNTGHNLAGSTDIKKEEKVPIRAQDIETWCNW